MVLSSQVTPNHHAPQDNIQGPRHHNKIISVEVTRRMAFLDLYGFLHESVVCWGESGLIVVSAMQQEGQAEVRELKENNLRISCRHFVRIQDVTTGA